MSIVPTKPKRPIPLAQAQLLIRLAHGETVFSGFLEHTRLVKLQQRGYVTMVDKKRLFDKATVEKWVLTELGKSVILGLGLYES